MRGHRVEQLGDPVRQSDEPVGHEQLSGVVEPVDTVVQGQRQGVQVLAVEGVMNEPRQGRDEGVGGVVTTLLDPRQLARGSLAAGRPAPTSWASWAVASRVTCASSVMRGISRSSRGVRRKATLVSPVKSAVGALRSGPHWGAQEVAPGRSASRRKAARVAANSGTRGYRGPTRAQA